MNNIKMSNGHILPMVRTKLDVEKTLFSEKPIKEPKDIVDMLGNYMAELAYETSAVICFDCDMCPICVSLVGVGDHSETPMPVRSVIQVALLSNAVSVAVVHNHPSISLYQKSAGASQKDVEAIDTIIKGCMLMGMKFYDSIILAHETVEGKITPVYYSMREKTVKPWKKARPEYYAKGLIKSTYVSENFLRWDDYEDASRYWGMDVTKLEYSPQFVASTPAELKYAIELVNAGFFDDEKISYLEQEKFNKAKELKAVLDEMKNVKVKSERIKTEFTEICEALEKSRQSKESDNILKD